MKKRRSYVTKDVTIKQKEVTQWGNRYSINSGSFENIEEGDKKILTGRWHCYLGLVST